MTEITINGEVYVKKSEVPVMAETRDGMEYCIIRGDDSSVFAGYVENLSGQQCVVRDARRIWYWEGAATISQLAVDGTSKPNACKFPVAVDKVIVTDAIEIIPCTQKAKDSIAEVSVWSE